MTDAFASSIPPLLPGPREVAEQELQRASERGVDVAELRDHIRADLSDGALAGFAEFVAALPSPQGWPFREDIDQRGPTAARPPGLSSAADIADDRLRGAWTGRIIGNLIGKPWEVGPTRRTIRAYLEEIGEYPLRGYAPFPPGADRAALGRQGYERITRGRITAGVRDDDVDFTIVGLRLLEAKGRAFTTADVAHAWLTLLPIRQVYTAERVTYANLVNGVPPESAGGHRNPYQEWIGALIRADVFGFVHPGDPAQAASLAFRDAWLSHRGNGVLGAVWAAALISSAFDVPTPEDAVVGSLEQVPSDSRLAAEITAVLADFGRGASWDDAIDAVEHRHPESSWVHTVNNAGALTAALLWGEGDFLRTVGLAVQAGLDTDSIGATAGAWAGARAGAAALPPELVEPLHGVYESGVAGEGTVSIDDLVARTAVLRDAFEAEARP